MPAHFVPLPLARNLECVMMAGRSSVAAGGIVTFHPSPIAVWLQGNDRLCDSLGLSIQASFPISFEVGTPGVTASRLRGIPCILLSGLSSPQSSNKR